jgi:predicted ATP-dependent endonuclease of OLD family
MTCLVGENESGKTNILTALLKLNPADEHVKIDLISDYPRHRFTEEQDIAKSKKFIEAIFKFAQPYSVSFTVANKAAANNTTPDGENEENSTTETKYFDYVKVERYYSGDYKVYMIAKEADISNEGSYSEITKTRDDFIKKLPRFVYYASYANLSAEIYLPNIIADLGRYNQLSEKEKNKAKTLKVLFDFVNLDPKDILDLGQEANNNSNKTEQIIDAEAIKKKEREIKLDSASSNMTRRFKEWWKQGDYKFDFSADGNYFRVWVSDSVRPEKVELENRSSGLQWFFSFYLVFSTEITDGHDNSIILLDEPGHTLHPMAQKDLSLFFNELAKSNQLLYTTHSPFLVDSMNITKVKVVYVDNKGNTNVSDDLSIKNNLAKKSIYPINSAIGITISDTMLIGSKVIIVEGVSDQIYLTYIKRQLMNKKYAFESELVFMPVDGTKNIRPVVSIVTGKDEELPVVLLDCDVVGIEKAKSLEKFLYSGEKDKVLRISDYIPATVNSAEIEDLVDIEILQESFNREFHSDIDDFVHDEKDKNSIVIQMEGFAKENGIELPIGWKVLLARRYFRKNPRATNEQIEQWKKLFDKFSGKKAPKAK